MKSIDTIIDEVYRKKIERKWDTIYWLVDLHDTIIKSTYVKDALNSIAYNWSLAALSMISKREDSKLILWTSSYEDYIIELVYYLKKRDITFTYINENPECKNTQSGDFSKKFYFNIILDDKAGFEPEKDWEIIFRKMGNTSQ